MEELNARTYLKALVHYNYNSVFKCSAEKHELEAGDTLSRKLQFFLADRRGSVWLNRNYDHVNYDVFSLCNIRHGVKVLRNVMRTGELVYVLYASIQVALWYMALDLEKPKERDSIRMDS